MKIKKMKNDKLLEKLEQAKQACPGSIYHLQIQAEAVRRGLIK